MNVALVYNLKKEERTSDEATEPPSTGQTPIDLVSLDPLSTPRIDDTYAEWDTAETIEAVRAALAQLHTVTLVEADDHAYNKLSALRPDIVFNLAEGFGGVSREAQIPSILEFLRIPYTGSDPLTLATCLDKARTKEVLKHYGIPTPHFSLISEMLELAGAYVKYPSIVKPLHEGSSKGIRNASVVRTWDELWKEVHAVIDTYSQPALVEEYLEGNEYTVAMLGNGDDVRVLPIVELNFDHLPPGVQRIYSYEAKWVWDRSESPLEIFECPARMSAALQHEIETLCRRAFAVLRCKDWCRIDVRLDAAGKPNILELNPLPGILPKPEDNSCFPKAARTAGLSYAQLIQTVLHAAAERYGVLKTLTAAGEARVA